MKNLLLTIIAILTLGTTTQAAQEAFQNGADQMNEIFKCQPLTLRPDQSMQLTVSTGGIAGVTQVRVERFFLGHSSLSTFVVKALPTNGRMGESVTYAGKDIRLSVNFTTQTPNGANYGVLKIREGNTVTTEELSCELMQQNPQVNYSF